jgi:hypothetical protein
VLDVALESSKPLPAGRWQREEKFTCKGLIMFSESTGFYLYSSLLQANAAILSILGVFTIFRVQSIQAAIEIIKNSLISSPFEGHYSATEEMDEFDNFSLKEKINAVKSGYGSHADGTYKNISKPNLNHRYKNWTDNEEKIDKIKKSIKWPSILLAGSIIVLSVFIVLSKWIHCKGIKTELYFFAIILIFESLILFYILKYIFKAVGITKSEKKAVA